MTRKIIFTILAIMLVVIAVILVQANYQNLVIPTPTPEPQIDPDQACRDAGADMGYLRGDEVWCGYWESDSFSGTRIEYIPLEGILKMQDMPRVPDGPLDPFIWPWDSYNARVCHDYI